MRDGSDGSVVNPVNGNCYVFDDAATSATNQTDTTAHVYAGIFCTDFLTDVRPTESVVFGGTLGRSVIFG